VTSSKYEEALDVAATREPLMEYVHERYSWPRSVSDSINWAAHGSALKRQKGRKLILLKNPQHSADNEVVQ
jgi:hypothetical protein